MAELNQGDEKQGNRTKLERRGRFGTGVKSIWSMAMVLAWIVACQQSTPTVSGPESEERQAAKSRQEVIFKEEATSLGLTFRYENGFDGNYYMPEIMGGGGALFDYDQDGDLDLYLVQGGSLTGGPHEAVADVLYRNDLRPGEPESLRFTDVTAESGIRAFGYGQGVAAGDFDNDGWVDLYVTNFGPNQLWRNRGDGTFEDVTESAGVQDARWSVSATFFDYDRDGFLDLFVGNYCIYDPLRNEKCFSPRPDYCNPVLFPAAGDSFWRNRGDGTFENVTVESGLGEAFGRALGAVAADMNGDGWLDLYVANDLTANQLWINQGNGTFLEKGMISGSGVVFNGLPGASMGLDAADFDNDGDEDLFMTHLVGQLNTLYVNDGSGNFSDRTQGLGLGGPSLPFTGFGTYFFDFDSDGWLDILVANGAVRKRDELIAKGDPYPFAELNQLYRNRKGKGFDMVDYHQAGLAHEEISRGAIFGDVDNDGDSDCLIVNIDGPLRFLRNRHPQTSRWIGLRLLGFNAKRDMLGARLTIKRKQGIPLYRRVRSDGSFASSNDPRVLVGLSAGTQFIDLEVRWPDATLEKWENLATNRYWTLVQGESQKTQQQFP